MSHRNPKTNIAPEWKSQQGSRTAEKKKQSRDLNGFGDPRFPLLCKRKNVSFERLWVESGLVALFCTRHSAVSRCRLRFGRKLGAMLGREQWGKCQRLHCVPPCCSRCATP